MSTAWHRHAAERLAHEAKPDPHTGVLMINHGEARKFLGKFYHLDRQTQNSVLRELEDAGFLRRRSRETLIVVPVAQG